MTGLKHFEYASVSHVPYVFKGQRRGREHGERQANQPKPADEQRPELLRTGAIKHMTRVAAMCKYW